MWALSIHQDNSVRSFCFSVFLLSAIAVDTSIEFSIEVRAIVDKTAFNSWKSALTPDTDTEDMRQTETKKQIKTFIGGVFADTNSIYQQLKPFGIALNLRIKEIIIIHDEDILKVYDTNRVNLNEVL